MEERLLSEVKKGKVDELVKNINKVVRKEFGILDEENDIEKWNLVPKLIAIPKEKQDKVLKFVEFMDTLLVPIEEKVMYVVSLCGLMEYAKLSIEDYDEGSLFTLADYYQNSSIEEIQESISITNHSELLMAIRLKTLDLEARKTILTTIIENAKASKLNVNNKKDLESYIEKVIGELESKDYYDFVK